MKKKVITGLGVLVVVAIYTFFVVCVTLNYADNSTKKSNTVSALDASVSMPKIVVSAPQITAEEPELVSDNEVQELDATPGTTDVTEAFITLADGTTVTYHVPEGHFYLTQNYIDTVKESYGVENDLPADGLIVTGNTESVFGSQEAVNAASISGLKKLLSSLYGDTVNVDELAYSEAYNYMKTGKVPETNLLNYSIEEIETLEKDGITYKAYHVSYDVDTNETGNEEDFMHNEQLMCYSDNEGDDAVEIIVYTGDYNQERALTLLHEFLNVG